MLIDWSLVKWGVFKKKTVNGIESELFLIWIARQAFLIWVLSFFQNILSFSNSYIETQPLYRLK